MARRKASGAAAMEATYADRLAARNEGERRARERGHGTGACAMELECWRCSAHGFVTYHADKRATFAGDIFDRDCGARG